MYWIFVAAIIILIVGSAGVSLAQDDVSGRRACSGTYLVDLGQSEALWTLSRDGAILITDSAEQVYGFSHQQGAWRRTSAGEIRATWLDFNFDANAPTPASYSRIDASLVFARDCDTFSGSLDLRNYLPTDDPLDPTGGEFVIEDVTFTGRVVEPW